MSSVTAIPLDNSDFQHISEEEIKGHWLRLPTYAIRDMSAKARIRRGSLDTNLKTWEVVNRCKRTGNCDHTDCVGALAILRRTLKYDCMVLVKQYRPALKSFTLEFPSGHVSTNESPETTALKELREETGYFAKAKHMSPATSIDPSVSTSTMSIVSVEIDGDTPLNKANQRNCKDDDQLEVLHIPMDELINRLNDYAEQGVLIDSKVYSFAIGLAMGIKLGKLHG